MHPYVAGSLPRHSRRRGAAIVAAVGILALAAGCAPEPEPEPTGFASEVEALEAARETYEGYVEATNNVDFSDPETAEPVYDWLTGDALDEERESITNASADNLSRQGQSELTLFELQTPADLDGTLSADVCLDVSGVEVLNSSGKSLVDPARSAIQTIEISLESSRCDVQAGC